ncbi:hypothetical protein C8R43DRAFT_1007722 [Mycena crocata]|nr:hypothetical protein C8R43DRAFT_1007722 [Mycena crocata]
MAVLPLYANCAPGPSSASSAFPDKRTPSGFSQSMASTSPIWFPLNDDASSSEWPPKFAFGPAHPKSMQSSGTRSLDFMEGIIAPHPQNARTRSATRPIPNRSSRSNPSRVPPTPTNLWQHVSDTKRQDPRFVHGLVGSDRCQHGPIGSERVPPFPLVEMHPPKVAPCLSRDEGPEARWCDQPPPKGPIGASTFSIGMEESVVTQTEESKREFHRLWSAQKRSNPHLPLMVSPLNPLRASMPPLYWKSVITNKLPSQREKVEWNFKSPLPSPVLQPKTRSRRYCDEAAEHFSAKAIFTGKLRKHCRDCNRDSLLKRVLAYNHYIVRLDGFEAVISEMEACVDNCDMNDAPVDDGFPQGVFLRDRDDFEDDDETMDDTPFIEERQADCYSLRLF